MSARVPRQVRPVLLLVVYGVFLVVVGVTATAQTALVSLHFSTAAINSTVASDVAIVRTFVNDGLAAADLTGSADPARVERLDDLLAELAGSAGIRRLEVRDPTGVLRLSSATGGANGLPKSTPTPTPRPTATPTPRPRPTPASSASPEPSAAPTPAETSAPVPLPSGRDDPSETPAIAAVDPGSEAGSGGSAGRLRIGRETDGTVAAGPEIDVSLAAIEGLGSLTWAVPSLVLAVPGMLLILAVMAQAVGGVLWLPVMRRRIGGFGLGNRPRALRATRRRRRMPGVPSGIHRWTDPRHARALAPVPNGPNSP